MSKSELLLSCAGRRFVGLSTMALVIGSMFVLSVCTVTLNQSISSRVEDDDVALLNPSLSTSFDMTHMLEGDMHPNERREAAARLLRHILNGTSIAPSMPDSHNSISFISPCRTGMAETGENALQVIEATSSLLVMTALTKADNATLQQHNLWKYFNGLFAVSTKGFLPRYSYPVQLNNSSLPEGLYHLMSQKSAIYIMPSTRIPNWPMFLNRNFTNSSTDSLPKSPCQTNETFCWVGSGRISAVPFHGTILLELLILIERERKREQDKDPGHQSSHSISQEEIRLFHRYWDRVYNYHFFLHEIVMRGCNNETSLPCYNILHPWETLSGDSSSSLSSLSWQQALAPTIERMLEAGWTPPFTVPEQVQKSPGYNETMFKGMVYLNECLANQTSNTSESGKRYPYSYEDAAAHHELALLQSCQFAVLDVGYAAALAQSDQDLRTVANWLSSQPGLAMTPLRTSSWAVKLSRIQQWIEQNEYVFQLLWNDGDNTFQSRYAIPSSNSTKHGFPSEMPFIRPTSANNLMVFWRNWGVDQEYGASTESDGMPTSIEDEKRLEIMALTLLDHTGQNSFDCEGSYPIWAGGCEDRRSSNFIDPRWNYFVGVGLMRKENQYSAFGKYLTNSTIKLICGANYGKQELSSNMINMICAHNLTRFRDTYSIAPISQWQEVSDECSMSSTSTSSILYHLLQDDFDFTPETPIPPIKNSWVITLIGAELIIAFAVGVSCVALSLSIVRRENRAQDYENTQDQNPLLWDGTPGAQDVPENGHEELLGPASRIETF